MEVLDKIGKLIRDPGIQVDLSGFIFALIVSAIAGFIVSALYQIFYENRATGSQIHRSFFLMAPSITALFIAIQFSLPLSLGLLGALSIIRFRTPIKEPEEIGFLMLLISSSVICAIFQFILLIVLLLLALVILSINKSFPFLSKSKRKDGALLLTMNHAIEQEKMEKTLNLLRNMMPNGQIESISYDEYLTTIHYSFTGITIDSLNIFEKSLMEITPIQKLNVFFNKHGALL